jgi:hypothetical protein
MDSTTLLNELWLVLGKRIRHTLAAVIKAEDTEPAAKMAALDVYSSSGNLLRASSAFVGNLADFVEYRNISGSSDESVAQRKLMSSTDFLADALDTFFHVSREFDPQEEAESDKEIYCFPLYAETEEGTTNRVSNAVNDGSRTLDGCKVILAGASNNHEDLRNFLTHLRGVIRDKFRFSDFSSP